MAMHNPPHSGDVLKDTVLRADGGITVTEFAKRQRRPKIEPLDANIVAG